MHVSLIKRVFGLFLFSGATRYGKRSENTTHLHYSIFLEWKFLDDKIQSDCVFSMPEFFRDKQVSIVGYT